MASVSLLSRRQWCAQGVAALVVAPVLAQPLGADVPLPHVGSLQQALGAAQAQHRALVVMATLEGCVFCRTARALHLWPLLRSGQPVIQIEMRTPTPILDAQGQATTHADLLRRWRIRVAPTVLFLGPGGRELAERMEGAGLPDFYGANLEDRTQRANALV